MKRDCGVIILNWNGVELLRRFLPRVVAHTSPESAEIVVADNGSTDDSVEWVKENYPSVRIMEFESNLGFAGGYNRALKEGGYRISVLLNSDAAPDRDGWIEPLKRVFDDGRVAAAQPKIMSERAKGEFEYAGAAGGFLDRNGYPYCRGRIMSTVETDNGQYDSAQPVDVDWASGACLAVDTAAYIEAGGLDEEFFAHMEEIDLCWRLRLRGKRVVCVTDSEVYHLGGASLDASSPRKTYLNFRNNLLMFYKNLPEGGWKSRFLFKRRLLDTLAWGQYILSGKWKHASAIVKAHNDYRRMKGNYRDFPVNNLMKDSGAPNILTEYFLRGRKTYIKPGK